ncbi:glycerol dehydrogenase [Niveibacterium terrae]|uniref:glycerol dehydrogenase n=1 Tax=Niveibacterium terrae TaxID=3373598 RepID=UPI003A951FF5
MTCIFPSRYIQGPDALKTLGTETARQGSKALLVGDDYVREHLLPSVRKALAPDIPSVEALIAGPCCASAIANAATIASQSHCDVVIGVGGGRVLDSAKLIAEACSLPLILIPSIAASDAPCSAIAVLCDEAGRLERYVFLKRSPDLVLVDTRLILAAPARMLVAGIGDALSTWYEMEEGRLEGLPNLAGGAVGELPRAVAKHCRDTILEHARAALQSQKRAEITRAFEAVIEANILLSGIGFESGGTGTAHAVQNGLAQLPQAKSALHGELVAVGLLAMLKLAGDETEFERISHFCTDIGLPRSLADISLAGIADAELMAASEFASTPAAMNRMPRAYTPARICKVLRGL